MKLASFSEENCTDWCKVFYEETPRYSKYNETDWQMWKIDGNTIVSKNNQVLGFHATDGLVAFVGIHPMIQSLYIEKIEEPTSILYPAPPGSFSYLISFYFSRIILN